MWKALKGQKLALGIICILLLEIPFKFMHWPGADALGLVSFPFLVFHQFRFFFRSNKHVSSLIKGVGLIAFLGLWAGLTFLLKRFIPETQSFYIISIASGGILLYVVLLTLSNEKPVYRRLDLLIHVFVVLSLFKVITRQNGYNLLQATHEKSYLETKEQLRVASALNDSLFSHIQKTNPDPALSLYSDIYAANQLISHIQYMKKLLAEKLTHDLFAEPDSVLMISKFASNYTIATAYFVDGMSKEYMNDYTVHELHTKLDKHLKYDLYKIAGVDSIMQKSMLNTDSVFFDDLGTPVTLSWENAYFFHAPAIVFTEQLDQIILALEERKKLKLFHFLAEDDSPLYNAMLNQSREVLKAAMSQAGMRLGHGKADAFTAQSYLILWGIALYFMALLALVKRLPVMWLKGGVFFFFILLFELFFLELEPLLSFYFPGNLIPVYTINFILAAGLVPVHQYFQDLFLKSFRNE